MASILIVDDSRVARMFLLRCLRIAGFEEGEFRFAADGREGLALLRERPADLVVTDLNMPEMDGGEFLRCAREDAALQGIPFFVVTSLANEPRTAALLKAGANEVLGKPIAPEKLTAALERLDLTPDPDGMDPIRFKLLIHAAEDAFRGLTFASLEKAAPAKGRWQPADTLWAAVTTAAPAAADLALRAPRDLVAGLYRDSMPDADPPTDGDLGEFLGELLNVLAGTWLGCIETEDLPATMGLPRSGVGLPARRRGTDTQEFALGDHHLALDARPLSC